MLKGSEIKIKRIQHKLRQIALAKKIQVSVPHLSDVENEKIEGIKTRYKATEFFKKLEQE